MVYKILLPIMCEKKSIHINKFQLAQTDKIHLSLPSSDSSNVDVKIRPDEIGSEKMRGRGGVEKRAPGREKLLPWDNPTQTSLVDVCVHKAIVTSDYTR